MLFLNVQMNFQMELEEFHTLTIFMTFHRLGPFPNFAFSSLFCTSRFHSQLAASFPALPASQPVCPAEAFVLWVLTASPVPVLTQRHPAEGQLGGPSSRPCPPPPAIPIPAGAHHGLCTPVLTATRMFACEELRTEARGAPGGRPAGQAAQTLWGCYR